MSAVSEARAAGWVREAGGQWVRGWLMVFGGGARWYGYDITTAEKLGPYRTMREAMRALDTQAISEAA